MSVASAHLFMFLWAALVASSFPVAAAFNPELSASLLVGIRFVVAGLLMFIFRPVRTLPNLKAGLSYALLGLLLAGNFVIMFIALRTAEPLSLAALFISQPLFAYLISWGVGLERLQMTRTLILACAAIAALIVLTRSEWSRLAGLEFGFGEKIYLIACLLSAAYNVLSRLATDRAWIEADPYLTTCLSLIAGGVLIALPDLVLTDFGLFASHFGLTDLLSLGYLTLFTSLGTFWILQTCALRLAPSMLAAYSYQAPLLYLLAELTLQLTPWKPLYLLAILLLILSFTLLATGRSEVKRT